MHRQRGRIGRGSILVGILLLSALGAQASALLKAPPPGSVYREYTRIIPLDFKSWRVTDPNAPYQGDPANEPDTYLPNSQILFPAPDLTGAISAEVVLDAWGGHTGTSNKRFRFRRGFNGPATNWITIPDPDVTPTPAACYNHQYSPVVPVPLADLQGATYFEGTSGPQICYNFGWGQWGWYAFTLRVYYDPALVPHPTGSITSHANNQTLLDNATVAVTPGGSIAASRVDVLAYYDGYDVDGDGHYVQYHERYQRGRTDTTLVVRNHVGTDTSAPFQVPFDTTLVPDQAAGTMKLQARILGTNGVWYATPEVTGLTLVRNGRSLKLYKPHYSLSLTAMPLGVWQNFWVSFGRVRSSTVQIPTSDNLGAATRAWLLVRTWNGIDGAAEPGQGHYTRVNGWTAPNYGENHFFGYDMVNVPLSALVYGTNTITFQSSSTHHGIEVLLPGPALAVEYAVDTTPPGAPTGLVATAFSDSRVELDWDDNPEPNVIGYNVYRAEAAAHGAVAQIATNVQQSAYTDTGVEESTTYDYQVTALNVVNVESPASSSDSATTPPDTTPPEIETVAALAAQTVRVLFDEDVDPVSAGTPGNYAITSGGGPVAVSAAVAEADGRTVTLTTGTLAQQTIYTLFVNGVRDESAAGNQAADSRQFVFNLGLEAHWRFHEGAGMTVVDSSGHGHTALLVGPQWSPTTPDESPFSIDLDGVNDYVDIGTIDVTGGALTIAMWVRLDDFGIIDARLISKAFGTADAEHYWMLSTINGNFLRFRLKTAVGDTATLVGNTVLPTGAWVHVAATYDGANMRLYQNGAQTGILAKTGALVSAPAVSARIGDNPTGGKHLDGLVDDVRIYSRALDATEIAALHATSYCDEPGILCPGECVVDDDCDEGNPCTIDTCAPAGCEYEAVDCGAGLVCNPVGGDCVECFSNGQCSDGDACDGAEICDPDLGCIEGTPPVCDDLNPCNGVESCAPATGCVAGVPVDCDDDDPCTDDACDPTDGSCDHSFNTAPCDDGNPGTINDTCDVGVCAGVVPPPSILSNGQFDGTAPWLFYSNGSAQFTTPGNEGLVHITSPGTNVQLYQANVSIAGSTDYRLIFDARSTGGRDFWIRIHRHGAPYENWFARLVDGSDTTQHHTIDFTTPPGDHDDARFVIGLEAFDQAGDDFRFDNLFLFPMVASGCGDGILDPGEDCDTSGTPTAGCDPDCTLPACGDGTPNPAAGEGCDDGNTTGGDGCSATCTVESPLVATPGSVAAGSSVTATWTGVGSAHPSDWIGLYLPGSPNTAYLSWLYTSTCSNTSALPAKSSGTCPVPVPAGAAAGNYELRLFRQNGYTLFAKSNLFGVTTSGPTLTATPTSVAVGGNVTATWAGIAGPAATDWLGLYAPGAADGAYVDWMYVSCSKSPGAARASGSCPVPVGAPGTYELRLFAANGFGKLATSGTFSAGATLSLGATTVQRGQAVDVSWANVASPTATDWLGLYTPGSPNTAFLAWVYVSCTKTPGAPQAAGTCSFTVPASVAPGAYQMRFLANNGYTSLATSPPLNVTGP